MYSNASKSKVLWGCTPNPAGGFQRLPDLLARFARCNRANLSEILISTPDYHEKQPEVIDIWEGRGQSRSVHAAHFHIKEFSGVRYFTGVSSKGIDNIVCRFVIEN